MTEKNMDPVVSVIIPTYNREDLICRAIESVLNQTYQDFEIIIVDDKSTDGTENVIKNFNDSRIIYVKHDKNKGSSEARNTGIKIALGKFVAFQDSDDEWLPTKLESQIAIFEDSSQKVGVVYTAFWKIEGDKRSYIPPSSVKQKDGDIHNELLRHNFIGTPAVVIRKECFDRAGLFDPQFPPLEDWEMWIRVSKYYHFKYIDQPLVNAYYRSDNISSNQKHFICALESILKKHTKEFTNDKESLSIYYGNLGELLIANGETEKGQTYLNLRNKILCKRNITRKLVKAFYLLIHDRNEFKKRFEIFFSSLRHYNIKCDSIDSVFSKNEASFTFPESVFAHKYCIGKGLEIGGAAHNPFGLNTLNVDFSGSMDTRWKQDEIRFCGKALKVDIVASGDSIPLPDESQDFIVSSHVIEHFADPIKALTEWDRLVKPGGTIFIIVPHKERTFEKELDCTSLEHLIKDFKNHNTKSHNVPHGHDHCWVTETFIELIHYMITQLHMKWEIAEVQDVDDKVGNGFSVIIRKLSSSKKHL